MTPNGRLSANSQTAYVLALAFDLLPEQNKASAAKRLAEDIRSRGYHLSTGFLGTPHLARVLSENGYLDVAYELLMQESYPSWLYPVKMGATTIWERWDGIKPDSSFQSEGMNSFNHYAYGAIGNWMYTTVAGIEIDPSYPGYKHFFLRPKPGGELTDVSASLESPYGWIQSSWKMENDTFKMAFTIPPNTSATVETPFSPPGEFSSGSHHMKYPAEGYHYRSYTLTGLSLNTTLGDLWRFSETKKILTKYAPALADIPEEEFAVMKRSNLNQNARKRPEVLTKEVLEKIEKELKLFDQ
jgi:alpha-L-rhamnosidase